MLRVIMLRYPGLNEAGKDAVREEVSQSFREILLIEDSNFQLVEARSQEELTERLWGGHALRKAYFLAIGWEELGMPTSTLAGYTFNVPSCPPSELSRRMKEYIKSLIRSRGGENLAGVQIRKGGGRCATLPQ